MFDNIGGKIKTTAQVFCWIGIVLSVMYGFIIGVMQESSAGILMFILVAGLGSLFSWIGSFMLYGFGELIEQTTQSASYAQMCYAKLQQIADKIATEQND